MAQIIDPLEDAANTIQGFNNETNDLIALGGDDTIIGANLEDFIRGGRGNDTITGGTGADTVRFEYNASDYISEFPQPDGFPVPLLEKWGHDVWTDFSIAEGDKLDVSDAGMGEQIDHAWGIGELETIIANSSIVNGALRFTWGSASITLQGVTSLDQLIASMFVFDTVDYDDYVLNFSEDLVPDLIGDDVQAYGGGNDTASGGGGKDQLYGEQGDDNLDGGTGDDTLYGGSGNDTLYGGADGADVLYGGAGNDILSSNNTRNEIDKLYGGAGNDTYILSDMGEFDSDVRRSDIFEDADGGIDTLIYKGIFYQYSSLGFPLWFAHVALPDNVEWGIGTGSALFMLGNALDNTLIGTNKVLDTDPGSTVAVNDLRGLGGNDTIYGQAYSDYLEGGTGNDSLMGQGGNDSLSGDGDNDTLEGGAGNDKIWGGTGYDQLFGDDNNDDLYGDGDIDDLFGGAGNDTLRGGDGNDKLFGDGDNDRLDGGANSDTLNGGSGNDTFITSSGNDEVFGDTGNDTVTGIRAGAFFFDGGAGVDKLDMSDATGKISLTLKGSNLAYVFVNRVFDDTIKNVESVTGGKYADSLIGDAAANWLHGGLGLDTLTGGAGADRFVFATKPSSSSNYDRITDFKTSDDKIALDETIFKKIGPTLSSSEFVTGTKAKDSNDYIIYNRAAGTLSYDADGSGSGAAVKFAVVKSGLILKNTHFMLDDF